MSRPGVAERTLLLAELRRRLRWPTDPERALRRLRRHASHRSPLLGERFAGLEDDALAALPVLTKDDLVDRFDELVADRGLRLEDLQHHVDTAPPGTPLEGYRVGATSGSSGRPALLPADRWEWAAKLANAARAQTIVGAGRLPGPRRVARIASPSGWHLSAQVGATLTDPRRPTLRLPATTPVDRLLEELRGFRPTVLNGYASVLAALAGAQLAGDLDIAPALVLSGGEPLGPAARAAVTEAWGVEPHDQYVTTEAGFVAAECEVHDGLHLLEHDVAVEVVDGTDRAVAPGTWGEAVLVSVLASRTVPLVRYRLDDAARLDPAPCRCGRRSPRLHVAGRVREPLRLGRPGAEVAVHPVVLTQVLDRQAVAAWQVRHRPTAVEVLVAAPRTGFDAARARAEVERTLAEVAGPGIDVRLAIVDRVDAPGGKAARFVAE